MSDLVERLRSGCCNNKSDDRLGGSHHRNPCGLCKQRRQAADEIERLRAALKRAVILAKLGDGTWEEETDGLELQALEALGDE